MSFDNTEIDLTEEKTPQLIGYHATTSANARDIAKHGVINANPKNSRWNHDRGQGISSLKNSVYIELDPARALLWYGDESFSGLVIIQFTEKTSLSDPQYDIKEFVWNFLEKYSRDLKPIQDLTRLDKKGEEVVNQLQKWCDKKTPEFTQELHKYLSKDNPQVPIKTQDFSKLLFYTLITSRYHSYGFSLSSANKIKALDTLHSLLDGVSQAYKGFKRDKSTAIRIPHDIGTSGRNRIIGVMISHMGTNNRTNNTVNHTMGTSPFKNDADLKKDVYESTFDVIYGDPKEIREKTGLIALGNYEDKMDYYWNKTKKEKEEKIKQQKIAQNQRAKERRAAKKAPIQENINILNSLTPSLAQVAQKVYDEWLPEEEGGDVEWGGGGICHDIADAMVSVLDQHGIEATSMQQQVGDNHVFTVAKTNEGIWTIDIPPYVYETGSGYAWKKIPDIKFVSDDVVIELISKDLSTWESYTDVYDESLETNNIYDDHEKYYQKIPEVKFINPKLIKRRDTHEVYKVSDEVANSMEFSKPIDVTIFSDGEILCQDGHHRLAAAKQLGMDKISVDLTAINAYGKNINSLLQYQNSSIISKPSKIEENITTYSVNISSLFSPEWKIKETLSDIYQGKVSKTSGPITISKMGNGKYYIINGNHRVIESINRGEEKINVTIDKHIPDMNKTGGAYNNMLIDAVQVTSLVSKLKNNSNDKLQEMPEWNDDDKKIPSYIINTKNTFMDMRNDAGEKIIEKVNINGYQGLIFENKDQNNMIFALFDGDKQIAEFIWHKYIRRWKTESAAVHKNYQGKGIAFKVYVYVIEKYIHTLHSDKTLTGETGGKGSFDLWVKLSKYFPYNYIYNRSSHSFTKVDEFTRDMMGYDFESFVVSDKYSEIDETWRPANQYVPIDPNIYEGLNGLKGKLNNIFFG
jgi:GNAT superfamily N-acetyltransferase